METRARDADRRGLRARRRGGVSRAARPRSSASCSRAPTAARSRSAAAASSPSGSARRSGATSSSGCRSTPRRPGGGSRARDRPLARARGRRAPAGGARCRSTRSSPTRSCRWRDRAIVDAGAALDPGARRSAGRNAAALGGELPPASTRSSSAAGLLGAGWWPLEGRRFCVSRQRPWRALRRAAWSRWPPGSRSRRARARRRSAEAERVLGELAEAGMTRDDHVVALGGGVVGDLAGFCAAHLPARRRRSSRCRPRWSPRSTRPTAARPGSTCPQGKNYVGAYHQPAAVHRRHRRRSRRCRATELAAGFVEVLKTGLLAGGALWERVRAIEALDPEPSSTTSSSPAPATSARWSPPTSATRACATCSTSATRSATRSRRRPATAATATARRSGWACWRRCDSPRRRELRDEVAGDPRAPRSADRGSTRAIGRRRASSRRSQRDKKRTAEGVGFVLLSAAGRAAHRAAGRARIGSGPPWRSCIG